MLESARRIVIGALSALLCAGSPGQNAVSQNSFWQVSQNPPQRWFEPTLTVDRDAHCAGLLDRARRLFRSSNAGFFQDPFINAFGSPIDRARNAELARDSLTKWGDLQVVSDFTNQGGTKDPGISEDSKNPSILVFTEEKGDKVYAFFKTLPGCGSACEGQTVFLSASPLSGELVSEQSDDDLAAGVWRVPDTEGDWTIFRSIAGQHYLAAHRDGLIQFYRVSWQEQQLPACEIRFHPDLQASADSIAKSVLESLKAFQRAVDRINGSGSFCGSMQTPARWALARWAGYEQALVRPWILQPPPAVEDRWRSENSGGDSSRISKQLEQWSLGGIFEYRAYAEYLAELDSTSRALASFYQRNFGWNASDSSAIARGALVEAVSGGMGFYMYDPYPQGEMPLRRAILSHRPLNEIRQFPVDAKSAAGMLDIAVEHPQALEYLLQKGADPDKANEFGKTPLMYAAQYNQAESVTALLRHGANPNARTFIPWDSCSFAITTDAMTALHYAVRYGSAAVIEALLEGRASVFSQASNGTPYDWLKQYGADSPARNQNLSVDDARRLATRIQPPPETQRQSLELALVSRAEKDYRARRYRDALHGLDEALSITPNDANALQLLQLAAFRTGFQGRSLAAGDLLLHTLKEPRDLANVWFNTGLACEGHRYIAYGRETYCLSDALGYFVQSWKLVPSRARSDKIREVIAKMPRPSCTVASVSGVPWQVVLTDWREGKPRYSSVPAQFIYVLHDPRDSVQIGDFSWPDQRSYGAKGTISPAVAERMDMGAFTVTALEAPSRIDYFMKIRGQDCKVGAAR